eukprot:g3174.t1
MNNPNFNKHRYHTRTLSFFFDTPPSPINPLASLVPQQRYNLRSLQHAEIQGIYPHPELKAIERMTPHLALSLTCKSNTTNKLDYTTLTISLKSSVPNIKPFNSIDSPIFDQRWRLILQPTFSTTQHAIS